MRQWAKPSPGATGARPTWAAPGVYACAWFRSPTSQATRRSCSRLGGGAAVAPERAERMVGGKERAQAPGRAVRRAVHARVLDAVPGKFGRPAALGAEHRLVRAPPLQEHDAERLVAAGHRHHVARLEQV